MPFLSDADQQFLREKFAEGLQRPVQILLFTKREPALFIPGTPDADLTYLRQTRELLEEVAALSEKIQMEVYDYISDSEAMRQHRLDKIPAVLVQSDGTAVRFIGVPAGYEFSTFVQDIFDVSTRNIELSPQHQEYLRNLEQDVHIQVFVTPT
ncbi:MAG: hypothetical protein HY689_09500 [Chloroflexi bacterium]|nr:hypothetical protein [Chloroflexota bacterium]